MKKIFFAFYFISTSAFAADWQMTSFTDNSVVFVDKNSISITAPYKKAWVKNDYSKLQDIKGTYPLKQYKSSVYLELADCSARTVAIKQEILYSDNDRQGEVLSSKSFPIQSSSFDEVVPESIGESVLEYICQNGPSIKRR